MKVWQHRWWWYEPRFRIKARQGSLEVLRGWNRRLSVSVGVHPRKTAALAVQWACILALHQLFFLICQLLFCLPTGSLAAARGVEKGTCQNYTRGFGSSTNLLTTDGERWKMWPVWIEPLFWKFGLHTQHPRVPGGYRELNLQCTTLVSPFWQ